MKCPYCDENLSLYESLIDRNDNDTIDIEEHWYCSLCDRTFYREMSYKVTKKGTLEE